ncbi:MAG: hypothetical protein AB1546_06345 [bacterium]
MELDYRGHSFRTVVGCHPNGGAVGDGLYILDTADSALFFGFFTICEGEKPLRDFAINFLKNRFEQCSDVYQCGEIPRPVSFLRGLLTDLVREWRGAGMGEETVSNASLALMIVIDSNVYVGRLNSLPVFMLKDRHFRQVFTEKKKPGYEPEIATVTASDGDKFIMCSDEIMKKLTKLELKNILHSERDMQLACNKLSMLASRYEDVHSPRIILIDFKKKTKNGGALLSKRNLAVSGLLAMLILLMFLWGDIARFVQAKKNIYLFPVKKKTGISGAIAEHVAGRKKYVPEEVLAGLAVPYDLAVASDGELFIVDDREENVLHYDPITKEVQPLAGSVKLQFPTGIEFYRDILYVVDFSRQVNRIYLVTRTGEFVQRLPDDGSRLQLINPKAVVISDEGELYVCDRGNNRIIKFSSEGKPVHAMRMPSGMSGPNGITLTKNGDIYVTLKITGGIARITDEESVKPFTIIKDNKEFPLSRPSGIAIDNEGYLYIADTGNRRIVVADPMGMLTDVIDVQILPDFSTFYPMSVKLSADGKFLYIAGSNQHNYEEANRSVSRGKVWRVKL